MRNVIIETRPSVVVNLTKLDWQLYDKGKRSDDVANDLNRTLETLVNDGTAHREVYDRMIKLLAKHQDFGAADSEPHQVLCDFINEVFGTNY